MVDLNEQRYQIIQSLPQLTMGFQPKGLAQFPLEQAMRKGTLWPALFSPYHKGESR